MSWPRSWSRARCWKSSQWLARRRTILRGRSPSMQHARAWLKLWILVSSNPSPVLLKMLATSQTTTKTTTTDISLHALLNRDFFSKMLFHIKGIKRFINLAPNFWTYFLTMKIFFFYYLFFTVAVWEKLCMGDSSLSISFKRMMYYLFLCWNVIEWMFKDSFFTCLCAYTEFYCLSCEWFGGKMNEKSKY